MEDVRMPGIVWIVNRCDKSRPRKIPTHSVLQKMYISTLLLTLLFPSTLQLDYSTLVHLNASCHPRDTCSAPRDLDDPSRHTCDCSAICALHNTCCIDAPALSVRGAKYQGPVDTVKNILPSCRQVSSKKFYFMHGECRLIRDHPLARRCEKDAKDWADPFGNVPVTNVGSHTTYKNVFCAICNGEDVKNLTMWQVSLDCAGLRDDMVLCHENKDFVLRNLVYIRDKAQWGIWLFIEADWVFRPLHLSPQVPDVARTSVHPCRPDLVSQCHPDWPEDDRIWTLRERNEKQRIARDLDGVLRPVKDNYENSAKDSRNPLEFEKYQLRTTDAPLRFPSDHRDTSYQFKSLEEVPLRFPNDNKGILKTAVDFSDTSSGAAQKWPETISRSSGGKVRTSENPKDPSRTIHRLSEEASVSPNLQLRNTGNPNKEGNKENYQSRTVQIRSGSTSRLSDQHFTTTQNPSRIQNAENPNYRTTQNFLEDTSKSSDMHMETTEKQYNNDQSQSSRYSVRQFRTTESSMRLRTADTSNEHLQTVRNWSGATSKSQTPLADPNQRLRTAQNRQSEITSTSSNSQLRTTRIPPRIVTQENQSNRSRTVTNMPPLNTRLNASRTPSQPKKTELPDNPSESDRSKSTLGSSNKQLRPTENPAENLRDSSRAVWTAASSNVTALISRQTEKMSLREACGYYMGVVHYPSASYRNVHCAICNFEKPGGLICDGREGLDFKGPVMNFGMLLDIDLRDGTDVGRVESTGVCKGDSQVFDPFSKKCRTVECGLPGYVLKDGKCVLQD